MTITVDRSLFLTADRDELVEEGDPRAAFLWASAGSEVSDEEAAEVGYKAPKAKQAAPAEDKAVAAPVEDKAAKKAPAKRARK